jgi:hypothetical protein
LHLADIVAFRLEYIAPRGNSLREAFPLQSCRRVANVEVATPPDNGAQVNKHRYPRPVRRHPGAPHGGRLKSPHDDAADPFTTGIPGIDVWRSSFLLRHFGHSTSSPALTNSSKSLSHFWQTY